MVKLMTCNVNYWRSRQGVQAEKDIVSFLASKAAAVDVLCLQNATFTQTYFSAAVGDYKTVLLHCPHFPTPAPASIDCSSLSNMVASVKAGLGLPLTAIISVCTENNILIASGDPPPGQGSTPVTGCTDNLLVAILHPGVWNGLDAIHGSSVIGVLAQKLEFPHVFCFPVVHAAGMVVLSKIPIITSIVQAFVTGPNQFLSLPLLAMKTANTADTADTADFTLLMVTLSEDINLRRIECSQLRAFLQANNMQSKPLFICGEFNMLNLSEYTATQMHQITQRYRAFHNAAPDGSIYEGFLADGSLDTLWSAPIQVMAGDISLLSGKSERTQYIFTSMALLGCVSSATFGNDTTTKLDYTMAEVHMSLRIC